MKENKNNKVITLNQKHIDAAISIVLKNRTKKTCKKCYDRGYTAIASDTKAIIPCTKCVDADKSQEEWVEYVKNNEDENLRLLFPEVFLETHEDDKENVNNIYMGADYKKKGKQEIDKLLVEKKQKKNTSPDNKLPQSKNNKFLESQNQNVRNNKQKPKIQKELPTSDAIDKVPLEATSSKTIISKENNETDNIKEFNDLLLKGSKYIKFYLESALAVKSTNLEQATAMFKELWENKTYLSLLLDSTMLEWVGYNYIECLRLLDKVDAALNVSIDVYQEFPASKRVKTAHYLSLFDSKIDVTPKTSNQLDNVLENGMILIQSNAQSDLSKEPNQLCLVSKTVLHILSLLTSEEFFDLDKITQWKGYLTIDYLSSNDFDALNGYIARANDLEYKKSQREIEIKYEELKKHYENISLSHAQLIKINENSKRENKRLTKENQKLYDDFGKANRELKISGNDIESLKAKQNVLEKQIEDQVKKMHFIIAVNQKIKRPFNICLIGECDRTNITNHCDDFFWNSFGWEKDKDWKISFIDMEKNHSQVLQKMENKGNFHFLIICLLYRHNIGGVESIIVTLKQNAEKYIPFQTIEKSSKSSVVKALENYLNEQIKPTKRKKK